MIYEIKNVSFGYAENEEVLRDLSLKIDRGGLLTILGKNGIGKTTLFNLMLGNLREKSGEILLDGKKVSDYRPREIALKVGYVPQVSSPAFDFTVLDYVLMGAAPKLGLFDKPGKEDYADAMSALRILGIEDLSDRLFRTLSGGQQQKAVIARAIMKKPEIILFDEPTAHLDYASQVNVLKVIKDLSNEGYSVVLTTHDPNHALILGGDAVLMSEGEILFGKSEEIITEQNLEKAYGVGIHVEYMENLKRKVAVPGESEGEK